MSNGDAPLGTPQFKLRGPNVRKNSAADGFEHWRYPQSIGADTDVDDINFNSNQTSEFAVERMSEISEQTIEPFIMFEFMKINEERRAARTATNTQTIKDVFNLDRLDRNNAQLNQAADEKLIRENTSATGYQYPSSTSVKGDELMPSAWEKTVAWIGTLFSTAERDYTGSICLYMPTDIAINDTMVYNEDTRRIGGLFESIINKPKGDWDLWNPTVMLDPTITAAIGGIAGKLVGGNTGAAVTAFATYGIGDILQTEIQRTTGQVSNPNELLRYASTALRSFTFNWTFLPDSEDESKQVSGLIKLFRKSAHAVRDSSTLIIVPDHVICSFHGAADIVQVPPCYIESVNVNYNPNNSSFFKEGNRPVEIKMSVTLKEIIPIYQQDVGDGY